MRKILFIVWVLFSIDVQAQDKWQGAWQTSSGDSTIILIVVDDYLTLSWFNSEAKLFYRTMGGRVTSYAGGFEGVTEFDNVDRSLVGQPFRLPCTVSKNADKITMSHRPSLVWKRIDGGDDNLSGNWRITQREQNGQLVPIHMSGPRKTIKILSGTRFQWAAINTETGEFSGTGGGRYTLIDGKYTEYIEFFSRDNSRVGMSLRFQARLDGMDWYHSGKSSKGDPINEVWSRGKR